MARKKKQPTYHDNLVRENVTRLMEERGWNRSDLARAYGCDPAHISQLMSDVRGFGPTIVQKLAQAFGVEIGELFEKRRGEGSSDVKEAWDLCTELQAGPKGELVLQVLQMLKYGPSEAIDSLEGLIKLSKKGHREGGKIRRAGKRSASSLR